MKTLYEWWSLSGGGIEHVFFCLDEAGGAQRGGDESDWRQEGVEQMNQSIMAHLLLCISQVITL